MEGLMNYKYMFLLLNILVFANSTIFSASNAASDQDSLKKILSFINQKNSQSSPTFDLSGKYRIEHIQAALDKIIQKIIDDRLLSEDSPDQQNDVERQVENHQKALQGLYRKNSRLFMSEQEEAAQKNPLTKITPPLSSTTRSLSDFSKNSDNQKSTGYQSSDDFIHDDLDDRAHENLEDAESIGYQSDQDDRADE